jgi:hypothetical protein
MFIDSLPSNGHTRHSILAPQLLLCDAATFRKCSSTTFEVALNHAVRLWVRGGVMHILLTPGRLKTSCIDGTRSYDPSHCVTPTVLGNGRRSWKPCYRHRRSLLVGNGVGFRPRGKIVHRDQKVSVSLVALWEGPCYIDGYHFEWDPDVVMMHLVLIPWPHRYHIAGTTSQHRFFP